MGKYIAPLFPCGAHLGVYMYINMVSQCVKSISHSARAIELGTAAAAALATLSLAENRFGLGHCCRNRPWVGPIGNSQWRIANREWPIGNT